MTWRRKYDSKYPSVDVISIHIPKTGGTTFYNILHQIYGQELSISLRRRHLKKGKLKNYIEQDTKVLHGHFLYKEIKHIHKKSNAKVICWLRDPIERVLSNYRFFIKNLRNPELSKNPNFYKELYLPNRHRVDETLLEYASKKETQNTMSKFLDGISMEELFFIGFIESFEQDLQLLHQKMNWTIKLDISRLNSTNPYLYENNSKEEIEQIKKWNKKDIELYKNALSLKARNNS